MDATQPESADAQVSLPDLRNALRAIMPSYWRRVSTTLEQEAEGVVINSARNEIDRNFLAEIATAQRDSAFDTDPLSGKSLAPELVVAVDALSQRAARRWHQDLGYPTSVAIFVCRSFLDSICELEISKAMKVGLLKMFGRLVVDKITPTLRRLSPIESETQSVEQPERVLNIALTMLQNELIQALNSGHPAPACRTLTEFLDSVGSRAEQITGQNVDAAELAPDALMHLSKLFAPILDDNDLDPSSRHMLATLMIPCFKLGAKDPASISQAGQAPYDVVRLLYQQAKTVEPGSEAHQKLLKGIQTMLQDFRDNEAVFVTTVVTLKARSARSQRHTGIRERQALRVAESKVRLEQAQNRAQLTVTERLAKVNGPLPPLIQRLVEVDWVNWLTLVLLRHGERSTEWTRNVEFLDDFLWTAEAKESIADVARLQSMLPELSGTLHEALEMVGYNREQRKVLMEKLRATYQRLVRREFRAQLHIPAMHARFKPRPVMIQMRLDPRNPEAVSSLIRKLKPGTWFEFLTEAGSFIRAKLSWVSPISDRFLFVDNNGLKLIDKTQDELRSDLTRGSIRVLSRPA